MNDVLRILFIVFFILSAICFVTALIMFFAFRIVEVVQDLNGTIARRQIEIMRERNQHAKNYGIGLLGEELGTTGSTGSTGRTGRTGSTGSTGRTGGTGRTGKTSGKITNTGSLAGRTGATGDVVTGASPVTLSSLTDQTQDQQPGAAGTTVLQSNKIIDSDFVIIKNIVYINTSETI